MERVEAQSHQLLVPVTMQLHRLLHGCILNFVDKHCEEILVENDEYKDTLAKYTTRLKTWEADPKNVSFDMPTNYRNAVSFPWALEVMHDDNGIFRVTYSHELPIILHNEIQKSVVEKNSKLWKSYEAFIRYRYLPAVERIGEIIDEHGHLMEPVPAARMKEIFRTEGNGHGIKWSDAPKMWFYSYMLAYVDSWKELISKWDDGIYDEIR